MMDRIVLVLIAIFLGYVLYDKLFNEETGGQSPDNPLGTEISMDEFLRNNKYEYVAEENKVVPEFGIPARVITYRDPTLPKNSDQYDFVLLFIDKPGKLRGIGSYFTPKVAIPPHQGRTEKLMTKFWKNVDKVDPDSKMNFVNPDDLNDSNPTYTYEVHSDTLNAVWIRDRRQDRIFITTMLSIRELKLREKLRSGTEGAEPTETAAKADKEEADEEASAAERLEKHKTLLTQRTALARDFRRLKKKRAKTADPTKKKIIEKQMKSIAMKAGTLQQMITELESTLPEGAATSTE